MLGGGGADCEPGAWEARVDEATDGRIGLKVGCCPPVVYCGVAEYSTVSTAGKRRVLGEYSESTCCSVPIVC